MIPLFKVFMPNEVSIGIADILNSGHLAYGTHTKNFETKLREYVSNKNISGNSVLFALRLIGIKAEDEVIVSPMSCLMTTQPIAVVGAKVVWADIDWFTRSRRKLLQKAIVHYHWAG